MPELSRFYGIIIRMYRELGDPHNKPHFHAYYQEHTAVFAINPIEMIAGDIPQRQKRLVEAWVEIHQLELLENWDLLLQGKKSHSIYPLK